MRDFMIDLFVSAWLALEELGIHIVSVPSIMPDAKTLVAFSLLKTIHTQAEATGLKVWLTGSWAITGRNGGYFKNIRDIDFTMRTSEDENRFGDLLFSLGLTRIKDSPMGANRFIDVTNGVDVDFGSVTYPGVYYQMPLKDDELVTLSGFSFRVIPVVSHMNIYKHILFTKGRNAMQDLTKLKILRIK